MAWPVYSEPDDCVEVELNGFKNVKKELNTQQAIINHLDDTDSNGLPHVPDGEPSKGRELGERLDAHGLAWEQLDNGSISGLDELGGVLGGLASTPVNLLHDLGELASNVSGVAVEHWGVAVGHLGDT